MNKIPKIIHYVWLGKGNKPEQFYKCLESWKKFCPDYVIKEWNEDNFDFSHNKYCMQAYKEKKYGFVADYIRVMVLNEYGGVYLDTDVEIVKNLDEFLNQDYVIGFENNVHCETAVMASIKNHKFLKILIDYYEIKEFINKKGKMDLTPNTPLLTYFLKYNYGLKLNNKKQVLNYKFDKNEEQTISVFPQDYFSPINYTTRKLKLTSNSYTIHYFSATWFTKKLNFQEKFLRGVYYTFSPALFKVFTRIWVRILFNKIKKNCKALNIHKSYRGG